MNSFAKYLRDENDQIVMIRLCPPAHTWPPLIITSLQPGNVVWVKHFSEHESQRTLISLHNTSGKKRKCWIWVQCRSPLVQNEAQQKALSCLTGFSEKSQVEEKWSLDSAHQQALGCFTAQQPRKSISPPSPFEKPHKGGYNQDWIAAQSSAACF